MSFIVEGSYVQRCGTEGYFLKMGANQNEKNPDGLKILLSISSFFFALWLRRGISVLVTWDRARARYLELMQSQHSQHS